MNRAGKIAFSWLTRQTDVVKISFIAQAMGSAEYQSFAKKYKPESIDNLPFNFIKSYTPQQLEANTIKGKRSLYTDKQADKDKLKLMAVWMPTGLFAPSRNGSYVPLGREFECTTLMHPFILKKQEAILEKAWSEAIPWLRSPDVGNTNTFTDPWLDYDPHLKGGADVYFVLDVENERVKIGVSNNISQRVNTLKRQYGAKKLIFISIIPSGGVKAESALHRFFSPLRIEKKGLGREWFSYTDELSDFVNSLNKYAIRSKCLKAYGII